VGIAVFLDRDGVLNRAVVRDGRPYPPGSVDELEILPDAPAALARLKCMGFLLIVVTNQPDVARGRQSRPAVEEIHAALRAKLPIDDFQVCFHDDRDACHCRKPKPGLLLDAARKHGLDLEDCYLIGDRWRDIDAGRAAGCRTILVDYRYDERGPTAEPDARVASIGEGVHWIVTHRCGWKMPEPRPK
jgi:D-glycero-D-manno-heptose 1,7-bisphosphate phosphatase